MRNGPSETSADTGCNAGLVSSCGTKARLGANSIDSADAVGAMAIPVTPPLDSGATLSACHCRWSSLGTSVSLGKEAQATVLQASASAPATFQPGRGQAGARERRSGCARLGDVNTRAVMANQG